jgi:hypothetical protein
MDQLKLFDIPQTARTSDDYWTPKWIFDALGLTFDLDVACPPEGPAHTPTKRFYTQADDGLAQPWHGLVWMNPPYSKTAPWVEKWILHANGIALLPDLNRKWNKTIFEYSDGVVALPENMTFITHDKLRADIRYSVKLYSLGSIATQALHTSKIGRVR